MIKTWIRKIAREVIAEREAEISAYQTAALKDVNEWMKKYLEQPGTIKSISVDKLTATEN